MATWQGPGFDVEEPKCRIEGWINVWDADPTLSATLFNDGKRPVAIWEPHFCVIWQDDNSFTQYRTEKEADQYRSSTNLNHIRLDGGKQEFDQRWGYEPLESIKEQMLNYSPMLQSMVQYSPMVIPRLNEVMGPICQSAGPQLSLMSCRHEHKWMLALSDVTAYRDQFIGLPILLFCCIVLPTISPE
ncbi:uncharacterized protein LOC135501040 [Lineus longissimus]|uniref:uncharacterized protein LOC135501040 n=1 Tax=Lineus longissimus TaxID=88925 RepID=UPI002B4D53CC